MSNDYRKRENEDGSDWYYTDGKRYIPRSMMEGQPRLPRRYDRHDGGMGQYRRPGRPSSNYRPRPQYYERPRERQYPPTYAERDMDMSLEPERSGSVAKAVFISSLLLLLMILLTVGGAMFYIRQNIFDRMTFVQDDPDFAVVSIDDVIIEADHTDAGLGEELTEEESAEFVRSVTEGLLSPEALYRQEGVTNTLLLGIDDPSGSPAGSRSDVMILLSVNRNTRRIIMTSILRDICVGIPGRSYPQKLNAAHAYGGAVLAQKTVEASFGVHIDRYIEVDLNALAEAADILGGLRMSVGESERQAMNKYLQELNERLGLHADSGKLVRTGEKLQLTGRQVRSYVCSCYTGGGDFSRIERQRAALEKLIQKYREADFATRLEVVKSAARHITTNYTDVELLGLATGAADRRGYEIVNDRLPVDGTWKYVRLGGVSLVSIDTISNRRHLLETVYGV